ncbi:MAG: hypothetical protein NC337_04050 [Roseburia sp.]|nr:hypothetical protein [Roseburia sp.]
MAAVLLNWVYICFTAFAMGLAFSKFAERTLGYRIKGADSLIFAGLVIATVYAQLFSLVCRVGLAADMILLLASALICAAGRREIGRFWADGSVFLRGGKGILTLALVLFWAYCTSRGYMHYDSDLYHAQSIRWIEEYGVVKGLGNLHVRFAYNSSFFALSALYGMRFLTGQSLHTVNGLFALLLSLEVLKLTGIRARKRLLLSDFARLGALYYLTVIYREITAPASDYAIMCIVFYLMIKWLSLSEENIAEAAPFALLCVGGVYAVSVKLTAGLILLLTLKPAFLLLRGKRYREIAIYLSMGLLVLLPWVARTALISGYLLYPFPELDILAADWKIPAAAAALDAAEIKTWGRGLNNAALVELGIGEWAPNWFRTMLPAVGKLLIIADMLCLAAFVPLALYLLAGGKVRTAARLDALLALSGVTASYLFWQFSAPLLRYGYAWALLTVALTGGMTYDVFLTGRKDISHGAYVCISAAVAVFTLVKATSLAGYVCETAAEPYYLCQEDYGEYALEAYEVQGVTFYYPEDGDRVGYAVFPALPRRTDIRFRGKGIEDGFCAGE